IPGDHHGADSHCAESFEPISQPAFYDVLELNRAKNLLFGCNDQGRAAGARHHFHITVDWLREYAADVTANRVGRTFPVAQSIQIDSAHAGLRSERHKG